jgi:hypothetical protein
MSKFLLRRLGVADDPASYRPTLQSCIEAVLEQSNVLMDDVLAGLTSSLVAGAANAVPLKSQVLARETAMALVSQSTQLKSTFAMELRRSIVGGDTKRGAAPALVRFDDFQFLDSEQIDANIEAALTQQEVLRAVEDVLPALNAMVSNLLGWSSVQAHLNPLKPESFVHALRETFVRHVPDDAARGTVMTLAAGRLGVSLRVLYRETAEWLRSQGVESAPGVTPEGGVFGSKNSPAITTETSLSRTMLTLDKLRRLLSGELNINSGGAVGDFSPTVPASLDALQDLKLVEPMMKRLADRAIKAESANKALHPEGEMLAPDSAQSGTKRLGRQLGEEVVRLMLDNLMQDQRLLAPVRDSLKAMEPLLIRLSASDARFFSERQHPARQFLERITHRSLAFSDVDAHGFARFQKSLDNSVSVLAGGGQGDAASFARVLRKLEDGWKRDEHGQRLRAEDAARELLHAEQRNLLAFRLAEQYSERVSGKHVPDMVLVFLRGPWAQVVAEAQLKFADGSVDPGGYQSLVDDLIWSVQLKLARRNRTRLVQMVPGMLVKMRQGLQLISFPQERMAMFFDELITFHEKAFEGSKSAVVEPAQTPPLPPLPAAPPVLDDVWLADSEVANSGFLQDEDAMSLDFTEELGMAEAVQHHVWAIDDLNTGSWVDLALGGVWVRAQLTWASPHRTLFMFISGSGLAHSMSKRTLERLKQTGLLRLVSDGHVMDNALDAVAQAALRNDLRKDGELPPA